MGTPMEEDIVMSDLTASRLRHGAAFAPVQTGQYTDLTSMRSEVSSDTMSFISKSPRPRSILPSEWTRIDRLLRHLYIDRKQSLREVQQHLREKYHLIVTEKQLTRRFSQLKLKKNFKSRERKAFIEGFKNNQDTSLSLVEGGQITAKKLLRWERQEASSLQSDHELSVAQGRSIACKDLNHQLIYAGESESADLHMTEQIELLPTSFEQYWESKYGWEEDVPTLITQLFAKLDLDVPADVEKYYVEYESIKEEEFTESEFIPVSEISNRKEGISCSTVVVRQPPSSDQFIVMKARQKVPPLKWNNIDVIFSNGLWVDPSPFNELYPFSSASSTTHPSLELPANSLGPRADYQSSDMSYHIELTERIRKVDALQGMCSATHPGLIGEMLEIADMYFDNAKFTYAEHWYRRITHCNSSQSPLTESSDVQSMVLKSWLWLSRSLMGQKRWVEARRVHQQVQPWILSSNAVSQFLIEDSLSTGGLIATNLFESSEAEYFYRQLAQIRMNVYGPKHHFTTDCLHNVSQAISGQGRFAEAQEMIITVLSLRRTILTSAASLDMTMLRLRHAFATYQTAQRNYNPTEPQRLLEDFLKDAQKSTGLDWYIERAELSLAEVYKSQKRYRESEQLFLKNINHLQGDRPDNAFIMIEFADLMIQMNNFHEAETHCKRALTIFPKEGGYDSAGTWRSCIDLGFCYGKQGKYLDELKLYKTVLGEASAAGISESDEDFLEVCSALERVLERIAEMDSEPETDTETEPSFTTGSEDAMEIVLE